MPSLNTGNAILSNPIKVDSSYNVGIGGAASGSFKLQVTGTTNLTGALTGTSLGLSSTLSAMGTNIQFNLDGTFGTNYYTMGFGGVSNGFNRISGGTGTTDGLYIMSATGRDIAFRTNGSGTTSMLITSGGLVGIQNLNPSAFVNSSGFGNLVVGGGAGETGITIYSGTTGSSGLMFADATTGSGAYTGYIVYRHATDKMEIATGGGTPRLTIESTGAATFSSSVTADSFNSVNGFSATYNLGTIAQNATITQTIPKSGLWIITNGGNLSGLILITRAGGSQGVQLIFTTGGNNVAAGTTSNPSSANYLNVWVGSAGVLSIQNVNAYTGPYYMTSIATY